MGPAKGDEDGAAISEQDAAGLECAPPDDALTENEDSLSDADDATEALDSQEPRYKVHHALSTELCPASDAGRCALLRSWALVGGICRRRLKALLLGGQFCELCQQCTVRMRPWGDSLGQQH